MSKILQTTKIAVNGRITLGDALEELGAEVGDFVQITKCDSGSILIAKVEPTEES